MYFKKGTPDSLLKSVDILFPATNGTKDINGNKDINGTNGLVPNCSTVCSFSLWLPVLRSLSWIESEPKF